VQLLEPDEGSLATPAGAPVGKLTVSVEIKLSVTVTIIAVENNNFLFIKLDFVIYWTAISGFILNNSRNLIVKHLKQIKVILNRKKY